MEVIYLILAPILLIILLILIIFFSYTYLPGRFPKPTESDYSHSNFPTWHLYYLSKYPASIKKGEKGRDWESHFSQNRSPKYSFDLENSKEITIKMVGDLMTRKDIVAPASRHLFDEIGEYLFDSDLTLGNMEFAVNPAMLFHKIIRYSVPYNFTDPFFADTKKFGKFGAVSLANNHINDSYHNGIVSTIKHLDKIGVIHSGASETEETQDEFPIMDVNGVKVAFLSYTFSTNNVDLEKDYGTNLIRFNALKEEDYDPSIIYHQIKIAKERGAELIISSQHWGIEFEYYPSTRLIRRAHELMDAGIDIIMGHHPHTLNPSEWYETKDGRQALSLYSLSNLTSYALKRAIQNMAEIVSVVIEAGNDENGKRVVRLKSAEKMPTLFMKKGFGKKADHRIIPLFKYAKRLNGGEKVSFIGLLNSFVIKSLAKEYRNYFFQKNAFTYR